MSIKGSRKILQLGAEALQNTSRASGAQRRTFSRSCERWRYGAVPKFTNLSNDELSSLLDTIREKVIMPSHLTLVQRKLIYSEKHRKDLLIDPVVVNLGGEEFTLQPIDRAKDLPGRHFGLFDAIKLMETKGDFDNVPKLLKGLQQAHLKLNDVVLNKVLRLLTEAGRQDVVLECARRGEVVGFDLSNNKIVEQVLWTFHRKAEDSEFEVGETRKALAWAEQIFDLMELPEHCGKGVEKGKIDPRAQARNVGILLELAAVRAENHLGGKDVSGKVEAYAQRLLATGINVEQPEGPAGISLWLGMISPVVRGMQVALRVLDTSSKTAVRLEQELRRVQGVAQKFRAEYVPSEKGQSPSVTAYDKLLGEQQ